MNRYPPTTLWSVATMWSAASFSLACYGATVAAMTNMMRRPGASTLEKSAVAKTAPAASVTASRPTAVPAAPVEKESAAEKLPETIMTPETRADAPAVKPPERPAMQMSLAATNEFSSKPIAQGYPAKKKKPRPGQAPVAQVNPKIVDPNSPSTK